jgi:spermidine/putrescine transport system ATP-binding protein
LGNPQEEPQRVADIDVRLVEVTKSFGPDVLAVDHVSLDVLDGEFFSLLGPSGCGKTTTLRMIGGFEEPTSGIIELQGEDVTWLPPYKRNVNTVFQNYALFPHLSVYENVAFGLRRRKVDGAEIKRRVAEMLDLVELRGFDKRKPGQISGGQAQRVALARALINRPAVLLLDEPLGALDLKLRKQMQIELKRIQQDVGITFIYVTHDQEEAMTMSDRICVMNRGRYEQMGTPEELYERPATRFVASFLGASNLLPGTVEETSGRYGIVRLRDGSAVRVPRAQLEDRRDVDVGVRPEKIRLGDAVDGDAAADSAHGKPATPDAWNSLRGRIRSTAYTGVSTQYQVALGDGHEVEVYEQNLERGGTPRQAGQEVRLLWAPDDTFALDAGPGLTGAKSDKIASQSALASGVGAH